MRTLLTLLLIFLWFGAEAQMIPNQSIELEYDNRGNRIIRKPYTGQSQNKGGAEAKPEEKQAETDPYFKAYPNPAGDDVFVEFLAEEEQQLQLKIYDANGRLVTLTMMQKGETRKKVDLSHLNAGVYQIKAQSTLGMHSVSIIHQ